MMTIRKYVLAFFLAVIGSLTMQSIHENVVEMYSSSTVKLEVESIEQITIDPIVSSVLTTPMMEIKKVKKVN